MKIKLLNDYRGVLTDERYFVAGEYEAGQDMPEGYAHALVAAGRAEEVKPKPKRAPRKKTTTTRRKTAKK